MTQGPAVCPGCPQLLAVIGWRRGPGGTESRQLLRLATAPGYAELRQDQGTVLSPGYTQRGCRRCRQCPPGCPHRAVSRAEAAPGDGAACAITGSEPLPANPGAAGRDSHCRRRRRRVLTKDQQDLRPAGAGPPVQIEHDLSALRRGVACHIILVIPRQPGSDDRQPRRYRPPADRRHRL